MLKPRDALVCGLLVWGGASMAAPPSAATAVALGETGSDGRAAQSGRKLTGRFLHITGGFVGFYWGAQCGLRANHRMQTSTQIRSTRRTRARRRRQHVTASEDLQVSTARRRPVATPRFRWSMRLSDGSRRMLGTISTSSSGRATRRGTTTTRSMRARRSRS
jgi:hypothetical protein